jgi:hypothetical protein
MAKPVGLLPHILNRSKIYLYHHWVDHDPDEYGNHKIDVRVLHAGDQFECAGYHVAKYHPGTPVVMQRPTQTLR